MGPVSVWGGACVLLSVYWAFLDVLGGGMPARSAAC